MEMAHGPLHGMGAHEGEAIEFRECVHRRVVCGGGGGWAATVYSLVRVWLHSINPYPMIYACMCMMWRHLAEPGRPPGSGILHLGL
jgi:hypothetical protein